MSNRCYGNLALGSLGRKGRVLACVSLWTFHISSQERVRSDKKINTSPQEEELKPNTLYLKPFSLRIDGLCPLYFFLKVFFYYQTMENCFYCWPLIMNKSWNLLSLPMKNVLSLKMDVSSVFQNTVIWQALNIFWNLIQLHVLKNSN